MKIACVQMDMRLGDADYNFAHAEELVRAAAARERLFRCHDTSSVAAAVREIFP